MTEPHEDHAEWATLDVPGAGMRVRYPLVTPQGRAVEADGVRVHVRSWEGGELYFEVSKETGVTAQQQYERERAFLERSPSPPQVSGLTETVAAGRPAHQFTAAWPDRDRVFTLIERDGVLYRMVYDPRSPLNAQIFATLELV